MIKFSLSIGFIIYYIRRWMQLMMHLKIYGLRFSIGSNLNFKIIIQISFMKSFATKSPIKFIDNQRKTPKKSPEKQQQKQLEEKVQVIIRIRPFLREQVQQQLVCVQDVIKENTLKINKPGNNVYMKFNNIVSDNTGQLEVFNLVSDCIVSFLKGINNTIFAYGQTGAGKTYTITGDCPENISAIDNDIVNNYLNAEQSRGILPRSLEMIFYEIKKRKQPKARVILSFFEIYNEKIYDLYNPNPVALEIRQSRNGEVSIADLCHIEVNNITEAKQFLIQGLKNRVTKSTYANSKSSRSHSIFQITYQRLGKVRVGDKINEFLVTSTIRIVDLAGSEKFKIPSDLSASQQQLRIQELTCINGSLSSLGHCISALIEKSRTHIPFRDSKLTRILSDSLIGNGKLKLIICISPSVSSANQTFSTLQFANRAKKAIIERTPIKLTQEKKRTVDYEEYAQLLEEYEKEKQRRIELQIILEQSDKKQLIESNARLLKQNEQLRQQLKIFTNYKNDNENRVLNGKNITNIKTKKPEITKLVSFQEFESKSFQSLSINKQQKRITKNQPNRQTSINPSKKKNFQNKIRKFLQNSSPEKSYEKFQQKNGSSKKPTEIPHQTKIHLLEKIRKAIKSKEEWFDLGNYSDSENDQNTRLENYENVQDQQLFKSQEDTISLNNIPQADWANQPTINNNKSQSVIKPLQLAASNNRKQTRNKESNKY